MLVAVGVGAAGVALYAQRQDIAMRAAVKYLRSRGVPAVVRLDRLGLTGASGAMALGAPASPDLVVPQMDLDFDPVPISPKGLGAPRLRSVRLVRPVLRVRLVDGRLSFGSLQRLIDEALKAKPSGAPAPDLYISKGELRLQTPAGLVVMRIDGEADQGRLAWVQLRTTPARYASGARSIDGLDLRADARAIGDRLVMDARLSASRAAAPEGRGGGLDLQAHAEAPYSRDGRLDGASEGDAHLSLSTLQTPKARARGVETDLQFRGGLHGSLSDLVGDGAATATVQIAALEAAAPIAAGAERLRVAVNSDRLLVARRGATGVAASGPFHFAVAADGARGLVAGRNIIVAGLDTHGDGVLDIALGHVAGSATGGIGFKAGLARADAAALAAKLAPARTDAALHRTLEAALRETALAVPSFSLALPPGGGGRLALGAPASLSFAGGALRLQPVGDALARLAGRTARGGVVASLEAQGVPKVRIEARSYQIDLGGHTPAARAELGVQASGSSGPIHDGDVKLNAALTFAHGRLDLLAHDCGPVSLGAYQPGPRPLVQDVALSLCAAAGRPLLSAGQGGWRAVASFKGLRARGSEAQLQIDRASGGFDIGATRGGRPSGAWRLDRVDVADTVKVKRFRPLVATVTGVLAGDTASIAARLSLAKGAVALGQVVGLYDLGTQAGQGDFTSARLSFVKDGFQPGDVAPALGAALPQADGAASLEGRASFGPAGVQTSGVLHADGLGFKSPAGRISGIRGDLRLASLSPLRSAPDQQLHADRLDTLLPLTDIMGVFTLTPETARLAKASATVADGRISLDPMSLTLGLKPGQANRIAGVLRLNRVDLNRLMAAVNLSNAVQVRALLDGELPFALGPEGLRFSDGRLYADGPGRLTIERQALTGKVATAGAAGAQPNAVQDFAYQALEDMAFDTLEARVQSRANGRLGVIFHIKGRHDPPHAGPTRIGLIPLLRGHAFDKPIPLPKGTPVDLTLDTSLNLDDLLNTYSQISRSPGSGAVHP